MRGREAVWHAAAGARLMQTSLCSMLLCPMCANTPPASHINTHGRVMLQGFYLVQSMSSLKYIVFGLRRRLLLCAYSLRLQCLVLLKGHPRLLHVCRPRLADLRRRERHLPNAAGGGGDHKLALCATVRSQKTKQTQTTGTNTDIDTDIDTYTQNRHRQYTHTQHTYHVHVRSSAEQPSTVEKWTRARARGRPVSGESAKSTASLNLLR